MLRNNVMMIAAREIPPQGIRSHRPTSGGGSLHHTVYEGYPSYLLRCASEDSPPLPLLQGARVLRGPTTPPRAIGRQPSRHSDGGGSWNVGLDLGIRRTVALPSEPGQE